MRFRSCFSWLKIRRARQGTWLVRKIEHPTAWRDGTFDPSAMKEAFADGHDDISVYEVASDIEEADVAAAIWVVRGAPKDPIHLLRIPVEDMQTVSLQVVHSHGETGLDRIDSAHRDIKGDSERFAALGQKLVARSCDGRDIVRTVSGRGLSQRLADFLESGIIAEDRTQGAIRALAKSDLRWPRQ